MPRVSATSTVEVPIDLAFAVSQTTGEVRLRWDPFIRRQYYLDGATIAAKGVRTRTHSRHGLTMVSEYLSIRPPRQVGMRMVEGPWFFEKFGGGWVFEATDDGGTKATWQYAFSVKRMALPFIAERIGVRLLQRDIERRIAAWAKGCEDPVVLDAARELAREWSS